MEKSSLQRWLLQRWKAHRLKKVWSTITPGTVNIARGSRDAPSYTHERDTQQERSKDRPKSIQAPYDRSGQDLEMG